MRQILAITILSAIAVIGASAQQTGTDAKADSTIDEEHSRWIEQVMGSIATIKPGMTRGQLMGLLRTEGGLYTRTQGRYVYKRCPYIKVIVKFEPTPTRDDINFDPNDKIVEISKPFLEYPIFD